MTSELEDRYTDLRFSPYGTAFLTDAIIVQRYIEVDSRLLRVMAVVKVRASAHSNELREFSIDDDGIQIGEHLADHEGLLGGRPTAVTGAPPPADHETPGAADPLMPRCAAELAQAAAQGATARRPGWCACCRRSWRPRAGSTTPGGPAAGGQRTAGADGAAQAGRGRDGRPGAGRGLARGRTGRLTQLPNRSTAARPLRPGGGAGHAPRSATWRCCSWTWTTSSSSTTGSAMPSATRCCAGWRRRLRAVVREVDTVSRHGGDEFLILLTDLAQPADAQVVADKLMPALARAGDAGRPGAAAQRQHRRQPVPGRRRRDRRS